jgi:hypothetical protein
MPKIAKSTLEAATAILYEKLPAVPGGLFPITILNRLFDGVDETPKEIVRKLCKNGVLKDVGYGKHRTSGANIKVYKLEVKDERRIESKS